MHSVSFFSWKVRMTAIGVLDNPRCRNCQNSVPISAPTTTGSRHDFKGTYVSLREHIQAAESRIRDADMAEEMVESFTKNSVTCAKRYRDAWLRPTCSTPVNSQTTSVNSYVNTETFSTKIKRFFENSTFRFSICIVHSFVTVQNTAGVFRQLGNVGRALPAVGTGILISHCLSG